jgi:cation diffusion facilitator CzcD-associated flavoprotein CzcO
MSTTIPRSPDADSRRLDRRADRVCVIGAGASGIAMCRALKTRGIAFDCFEKASDIGGLWRIDPKVLAGSYESLHPNTSRTVMQYPSFPMPEDYPHYPNHGLVLEYFERFVDHFGLREDITFGTEVTAVEQDADGAWSVTCDDRWTRSYRAVAVASGGRHAVPVRPRIDGTFEGRELHSFEYFAPEEFAGKRVIVVGLGATAADIASEVSRVAAHTILSVRTGHYVVPKLIEGRPVDVLSPILRRLSIEARRPLLTLMLKLVNGDMTAYGLPKPPYKPGQGPLVATTELLPAIAHGRIEPRSEIARLDGQVATFKDGTCSKADAVIYCTGYEISFPFLSADLGIDPDDAPPLYHLVVPPAHPRLYFIGLLHSMMALMPLAEAQSEWVADLLSGVVTLPPATEMLDMIRRARRRQERRFYDTSGHMLVDPIEYAQLLDRERMRHRARAVAVR